MNKFKDYIKNYKTSSQYIYTALLMDWFDIKISPTIKLVYDFIIPAFINRKLDQILGCIILLSLDDWSIGKSRFPRTFAYTTFVHVNWFLPQVKYCAYLLLFFYCSVRGHIDLFRYLINVHKDVIKTFIFAHIRFLIFINKVLSNKFYYYKKFNDYIYINKYIYK